MTDELTYGDLFAGYDGLGMGVRSVLGGRTAWYADCCRFDKHGNAGHTDPHGSPCAIMAHHHPDVPNLGDVTKVDWRAVEPVDVITGGSPCQDLSHAGKRAGMKAGTRSGLWASMCDAVDIIRPRLVVWENVRGALSAEATSAVEPCPLCVGDEPDVTLRALGRVLGDLAELGYDASWYGLRAADVGAAHGRFRVFLFATPAADAAGAGRETRSLWLSAAARERSSDAADARDRVDGTAARHLIPTANDFKGSTAGRREPGQHRHQLDAFVEGDTLAPAVLLPTPAVNDMGAAYTPEEWDAWTATQKAKHGNGNGHGKSLEIEAQRLLPTPVSTDDAGNITRDSGAFQSLTRTATLLPTPQAHDAAKGKTADQVAAMRARGHGVANLNETVENRLLPTPQTVAGATGHFETPASERRAGGHQVGLSNIGADSGQDWGEYGPAIRRWEAIIGRPAPSPTELGLKGQPRLSPRFVEWLMGLPDGHVTAVPGISRNDQLKALGNGVVPQQCAAATLAFLQDTAKAASA